MTSAEKKTLLVGIDNSDHSFYALEWTLDHFFVQFGSDHPFKLIIIHAQPIPISVLGIAGPGAANVIPMVETDLKKTSQKIVEKARETCKNKGLSEVEVEVVEGDARNVMCDGVDRHKASILVVGSHNYGAVKRVFLGSVSDYCAHTAHCSVLIVKRPQKQQ